MKRHEIIEAGRMLEMQPLKCAKDTEYQRQVEAIIGKVPCPSERFVALCYLMEAKIDELRSKIDAFCKMHRYRNQLKEEIMQILKTE